MHEFPSRRMFLAASAALPTAPGALMAQGERDYVLETRLSPESAAIVCPAGDPYERIARLLSEALAPHCGGRLDVRPAAAEDSSWPASPRHLILLGNAIVNPLLRHLYVNHYTRVDEYFPGPSGIMVHTAHNPFGGGRNVLVLGSSDAGGAERAAQWLAGHVEKHGPNPGFLLHSESPRLRYDLPPTADFAHGLRSRKEQIERGDLPWLAMDYGILYHFNGQRQWAELFRDLHLHMTRYAKDRGTWPENVLSNRHTIGYFYLYRVLIAWDLIEESPVFSPAERAEITALFLEVARAVAGLPYFRGKSDGQQPSDLRHAELLDGASLLLEILWQSGVRQSPGANRAGLRSA